MRIALITLLVASIAHAETDPFDAIKNIPVTDDVTVSFGGQVRLRYESWNNFGLRQGAGRDDDFLLTRLRAHADVKVGEDLRFFIEGKSAFSTDNDPPVGNRALEVDELALQNAYVEWTLPITPLDGEVTVRPGRQELLFGKQRLVSPLDWANSRRTFDGVSVDFKRGDDKVTGFWTRAVVVDKYDFNDATSAADFFGIYYAGQTECPITGIPFGLDAYWLGLDRENVSMTDDEHRHTFGARLHGKVPDCGADFDIEGAYQTGSVGNADISAWMFAAEVGYQVPGCPMSPRVHLGFDYASGDDGGGDVETFNQLFPLGHAFLGWADLIGRQNVIALNPGVTIKPTSKLTVKANGHFFWRADESDAVYNAGGAVLFAAAPGSRDVGAEFDLLVQYQIDPRASVAVGYSHFWAGDFVEDSGGADDLDFAYGIFQYTF